MQLRQFCYLVISSSYFLCKVKLGKIKRSKSTQFLKMNYVFSETCRGIDRYYTGYRPLNQHVCLHHRHMTIDFPHYNKIYPLPFLIFFYLEKNIRNKEYFFEYREVIKYGRDDRIQYSQKGFMIELIKPDRISSTDNIQGMVPNYLYLYIILSNCMIKY